MLKHRSGSAQGKKRTSSFAFLNRVGKFDDEVSACVLGVVLQVDSHW